MLDATTTIAPPGVTTPGWLRRSLGAIVVLAVLAGGVSLWAAESIRSAAQTVGKDAEPSVELAYRMAATLEDMNAAALADSLTDGGAATGTSLAFRAASWQLAKDLVAAGRDITYDGEVAPLQQLQIWVLAYQEAIAEARTYGAGDARTTASRVQWASRVNREFAVPRAEELAQVNEGVLEREYADYRSGSLLLGAAGFLMFALLVAAMLAIQLWLARRMRRLVNPLLAGGTAVAVAAGLWFGWAVLAERADLRAAKSDAYDSLSVLFRAKAAANALRGDMSLWLLDPATRTVSELRMEASRKALVETNLGNATDVATLRRELEAAVEADRAGRPVSEPHPGGLLGKELDNITFGVPERQAATESVLGLFAADAVVRSVQALEMARDHTLAVVRWTEDRPGSGTRAFKALEGALDRTIEVNQKAFDRRVESALGTARAMPFVTSGGLVLAVLLAAGGLWQRLREYR